MPELPEVEEVRRTLTPHITAAPITAIHLLRPDFLTPPRALQRLVGQRITRTHRHGKKLFCIAADGQTLLLHLGMTGRIDCLAPAAPLERHTHFLITLATGVQIRFRDPRRFGGLWYYPTFEQAAAREIATLGQDALRLAPHDLAHWKLARAGRLKHRLLAQHDVAGLGNIYVDEALWAAQLHPLQRVSRIAPDRLDTLIRCIHQVLLASIASGGTTLRDYRNVANQPGNFARQLHAYGRAGQPCHRCATPLRSALIAGRTTVFCPHCQRQRWSANDPSPV